MTISSLLRLISGDGERMQTHTARILSARGVDPASSFLPASDPIPPFTLELPPPIDGDLVAFGYPVALAHQLSDAYLSSAQKSRERCAMEFQTLSTSLSSQAIPLTGSDWQFRMEQSVRARYTLHMRQLRQSTLQWHRENAKNISERDARSIDRPFDMVSLTCVRHYVSVAEVLSATPNSS
jgi:hypothetical protein